MSLIKEYSIEAVRLDNIHDSFEPIPGGIEECEYFARISAQMKLDDKACEIEGKLNGLYEEIGKYEFFGKIDFLAGGPGRETIIGETLYYDNYKDYIKEVRESQDCGRPISASDLTFADKETLIKCMKAAGDEPTHVQNNEYRRTHKRLEEFKKKSHNESSITMTL